MNKKIKFTFGTVPVATLNKSQADGRPKKVSPPTNIWQRFLNLAPQAGNLLVMMFLLILLSVGFILPGLNTSTATSLLFYGISLILFTILIIIYALSGTKYLVDVPLVLSTVIYALISMTILLIPASGSSSIVLGNGSYMVHSGLTIMAYIVLFYYIALHFRTLRDFHRAIGALLGGIIIALAIGIFDYSQVTAIAPILVAIFPLTVIFILRSASRNSMRLAACVSFLSLAFILRNILQYKMPWVIMVGSIVWLIVVLVYIKFNVVKVVRSFIKDYMFYLHDEMKFSKLVRTHWELSGIILGILMILASIVLANGAKLDLNAQFSGLFSNYSLSIALIGSNATRLLVGSNVATATGGSFWADTLQTVGLIGTASLAVLMLWAIAKVRNLLHGVIDNKILALSFVLIAVPVAGLFMSLPTSVYFIWWACWGLLAAAFGRTDEKLIYKPAVVSSDQEVQSRVALNKGLLYLRRIIAVVLIVAMMFVLVKLYQAAVSGVI